MNKYGNSNPLRHASILRTEALISGIAILCCSVVMTNVLAGYLQSLGADIYHATIQAASHSLIPVLQSIVIVGVIAGAGLIGYDVLSNRKKRPNLKELAKEVRKQQDKEELEQIDKQDSERNEGDDRYTPTNL